MTDATPPDPHLPPNSVRARLQAIGRRARADLASVIRVAKNPLLPALLFGATVAAFFAAFVLHAPNDIVFGILAVGFFTAILETRMHGDGRD